MPVAARGGGDPIAARVIVLNLTKTARQNPFVHLAVSAEPGAADSGPPPANSPNGRDPVIDIAVTFKGAAAWIAKPASPGSGEYQVLAVDGRGLRRPAHLLDSGAGIGLSSLRRSGREAVRWTNGGAPRSAVLR